MQRLAAALQDEISIENATLDRASRQRARMPGEGWSQRDPKSSDANAQTIIAVTLTYADAS